MKSRKSETPVMISGLIIGILLRKSIVSLFLPLRLNIPIAAIVPIMVEIAAATSAITMVF